MKEFMPITFYRLLQRASVVHIAYCSRSDDKHTGEPSRYIYQLDYESPHDVVRTQVPLSVSLAPQHPLAVPKTGEVAERLYAFLDGGGTYFFAYVVLCLYRMSPQILFPQY